MRQAPFAGGGVVTRDECLQAAAACVTRDRDETYGVPEDSFTVIAGLWNAYLGARLTTADVAAMMVLLKIARVSKSPGHADSWIDIAGYAACGAECGTR